MCTEKELLQLAGKLATTCNGVVNSDAKTLSDNIKKMEIALNEYDNAIMSNLNKQK